MANYIDSFKLSLQTLLPWHGRASATLLTSRATQKSRPVAQASQEPFSSALTLPQVQQQSKTAKAEESSMSTGAVVLPAAPSSTAAAPVHVSFIKRLGSLFVHGAEKAIALVEKDAKPIENIALVAGTLAGVGPEVQAAEDTFDLMFGEVVQVEQVATAVGASEGNGAQKLAAAIPQVESIILANPLFKGKTITDLTKWNNAIASITGSLYDLGNSVEAPTPAPVAAETK